MSFEFYQGTASENTTPKITIRKGGQLVLTTGAVAMLGDDVDHVPIGYDVKTRVVGLRAAGENAEGRYRLRIPKKGDSRLVTGKRFFAHYGLKVDKARTFDAEEYEGGIVGFKLITDEPVKVEAPVPALAKKAPARKTGGRRKAA